LVRVKPDPRVLEWMEAAEETLLHLSVLTLGKIRKGLAALPQGRRRMRLEAWLEVDLRGRFSGRILPVDAAVADRWGLLAATALHHNLTMISRNVCDFAAAQVPVLNPWEAL
jgi:predicted nucleic acid-binding protein